MFTENYPNLELHVADDDVTSGTLTISWCLSKDLIDLLAASKCANPNIIISVVPDDGSSIYGKELRKVVPLKDLIAYVEMPFAGKVKVFGMVSTHEKDFLLRKSFMDQREFRLELLKASSAEYSYDVQDGYKKYIAEPLSLEIPQAIFAKEPPEWEKAWVNWLFKDKPQDQCEYRRRRIFAYSLQVPLILLFATLKFVLFAAFGLLLGIILHPRNLNPLIKEAPNPEDQLWCWYKAPAKSLWASIKINWQIIFVPSLWLVLTAVGILVRLMIKLFLLSKLISLVIILPLVLAIMCIVFRHKIVDLFGKFITWVALPGAQDLWYLKPEEQQVLLCTGEPRSLKVKDLPAQHRTIKLRFQEIKSKVCRPFAK